jgi:hypothetical protein
MEVLLLRENLNNTFLGLFANFCFGNITAICAAFFGRRTGR